MLSSQSRQAALETLVLVSGGSPTEEHFRAVAECHAVSARTIRRVWRDACQFSQTEEPGLSARAALASLDGVDPRVVYAASPSGPGWWPDLQALRTLASFPTLLTAHEALVAQGHPVPCYAQFTRRLSGCLNPAFYQGLRRGGVAALELVEIFITRRLPPRMRVVEMDSFELPIDVEVPRRARPVKPWLMVAIDRGCKVIPAWLLLPGRPTAADARTLLALTIRGHRCPDGAVLGGVPRFVMPDNGGEFRGHEFTTALVSVGCEHLPVPASTPHLKGTVERSGQHLESRLVDLLPGATHGPQLRDGTQPWRNSALLGLSDLERWLDRWFSDYNVNHRSTSLRGVTPLQAWLADLEPVVTLSDAAVWRALLPRVTRVVSKKGIQLDYRFYVDPALAGLVGTEVSVGWLPRHGETVEVFDPAGQHICTAAESTDLTEDEVDQIMTGRLRRERVVRGLLNGSVEVRDQYAAEHAPPPGPDTEVADDLPAPAARCAEAPLGDEQDLLIGLVLGDER